MMTLEKAIAAATVAVLFLPALAAEPAVARYAALAGLAADERLVEQGRLVDPLIGDSTAAAVFAASIPP